MLSTRKFKENILYFSCILIIIFVCKFPYECRVAMHDFLFKFMLACDSQFNNLGANYLLYNHWLYAYASYFHLFMHSHFSFLPFIWMKANLVDFPGFVYFNSWPSPFKTYSTDSIVKQKLNSTQFFLYTFAIIQKSAN